VENEEEICEVYEKTSLLLYPSGSGNIDRRERRECNY
jgi:hypothetical protein